MSQPSTPAQNLDPYRNFRFRVQWDGRHVAGISRVSALKQTTEVVRHREGAEPGATRKSPGQTEYDPITLERGVTRDREFADWAARVRTPGSKPDDFRKDIIIELYDESGQLALAYRVFRCWVSEYQALPDLDAQGNAVAIEQIRLENEGWERDESLVTSGR